MRIALHLLLPALLLSTGLAHADRRAYGVTYEAVTAPKGVLYVEIQDRLRGDSKQSYEGKLILARDFGHVNVAVNAALEEERTMDPVWNPEFEYAGGASYEVSPAIKLSGEAFGKTEKADTGG